MRLLALALFSALLLAGCTAVKPISPDSLVPYTNAENGFSISYPDGWSINGNPEDPFAVAFDSYGEFIQVSKPQPTESLSLKELAGFVVAGFKEGLAQQTDQRVVVVFDGPTVVHGYNAHAVVLEVEGELGAKVKAVVIQSKKNPDKIYAVAVSAPKNVYLRNSATYDAVIESFREN